MCEFDVYRLTEEHEAVRDAVRVCGSSLIPAANKLGTTLLLLSASEGVKQRYLPPVARGDAMFSYCLPEAEAGSLPEAEAGSDAAAMKTWAVRDGGRWVLDGTKSWITNQVQRIVIARQLLAR